MKIILLLGLSLIVIPLAGGTENNSLLKTLEKDCTSPKITRPLNPASAEYIKDELSRAVCPNLIFNNRLKRFYVAVKRFESSYNDSQKCQNTPPAPQMNAKPNDCCGILMEERKQAYSLGNSSRKQHTYVSDALNKADKLIKSAWDTVNGERKGNDDDDIYSDENKKGLTEAQEALQQLKYELRGNKLVEFEDKYRGLKKAEALCPTTP